MRRAIAYAVMSSVAIGSLVGCSPTPAVSPGPSASVSSSRFDEQAERLCRSIDGIDPDLKLASALDSNDTDVLAITPPDYLDGVLAQLEGHENDYVAVCYFLSSPPETKVLIMGVIESGQAMTIDSFT